MRSPGDILLISCYELGHQPFHLASLCAMLQQAGYVPATVDTAVETLTEEAISRARLVAISVPMHTALRLGQQVARRVRSINPSASICFYGLYALLNADYLLQDTIDAAIGGEYEGPFLNYVDSGEQGKTEGIAGVTTRQSKSGPWIKGTSFIPPVLLHLPTTDHDERLETNGA